MGLYTIDCPTCGEAYQWFSGNSDKRCGSCVNIGFIAEDHQSNRDPNDVINEKLNLILTELAAIRIELEELK